MRGEGSAVLVGNLVALAIGIAVFWYSFHLADRACDALERIAIAAELDGIARAAARQGQAR